MSNDELKLINVEYDGERVTAPILEGPFIRLSMMCSNTRMNRKRTKEKKACEKCKQHEHVKAC